MVIGVRQPQTTTSKHVLNPFTVISVGDVVPPFAVISEQQLQSTATIVLCTPLCGSKRKIA